jgi:outer membrane lipoprotein
MKVIRILFLCFFLPFFLAGCSSTAEVVSPGPTPSQLSATADPDVKGRLFTWGGSVISVKNLKDRTLLEVMAYPLATDGKPRTDLQSMGRFIADYKGFLEPTEYQPGRLVTVTGSMLGYLDGKVGEADYRHPALQANELRLWERQSVGSRSWSRPAINVGVGVGGGSHSSWGNIGIGFGF